jgi:hypothetical protein
VLLPVLILMWTSTPRAAGAVFIVGLALLGATGPRLPRESVPEVLADLPAGLEGTDTEELRAELVALVVSLMAGGVV